MKKKYGRQCLTLKIDIYLILESNVQKLTGYDLSWYEINISEFNHLTNEVHIPVFRNSIKHVHD